MKICFAGGFGHYDHAVCRDEDIAAVLVSDEDTDGYRKFCTGKKQYTDYRTMIDTERPDAVVIDSIFNEHFEMARYALEKGIHAFCEKPVCLHLSETEKLRLAAKKHNALLYGMFTTRFEAPFYTLKKLVDSGEIGDVKLVNGQKTYILGKREPFYYDSEKFGNTFSWVGIHSVEEVLYITNKKLTDCHYFAKRSDSANIDDRAVAICEFEDMLGTFTVDYLRSENAKTHGDDRLRLVGTKGTLEAIGGKVYKNGEEIPLITPKEKIFENFLKAIEGSEEPICTTESTLEATAAVLRISGLI